MNTDTPSASVIISAMNAMFRIAVYINLEVIKIDIPKVWNRVPRNSILLNQNEISYGLVLEN